MWLYVVLAIAVAWGANAVGISWPIAVVIGVALPGLGSWLWLRVSGRDAPTNNLKPGSPRTIWFLKTLEDRYRAAGRADLAQDVNSIAILFESGRGAEANARLGGLSNRVARDRQSTDLIAQWQQSWRDSGQ